MEHASPTHTVFNQTPPLTDYNLFAADLALREAVQREGGGAAADELAANQLGESRRGKQRAVAIEHHHQSGFGGERSLAG